MSDLNHLLALTDQYEQQLPPFPEDGVLVDPNLASTIDHTLLKAEGTIAQIEKLCVEARENHFASVCVNGIFVARCAKLLQGSGVPVCTVVGFPLGATPTRIKVAETRQAITDGAKEIDMVIPVGMMKSGEYACVYEDIAQITEAAHAEGALVKVILEMAYLSLREKILGCLLSKAAGADFVKTSTGFAASGASVEDVRLMRSVVGPVQRMGVKAAGGIRTLSDARAMLGAGANRIGASASLKILEEAKQQ